MNQDGKKKYAMVIDTSKCYDCKACMISCKVENNVPKNFWRNWVKHTGRMSGMRTQFQPGSCMQCDAPSCVEACPVGATFKGRDGLVEINPSRCIGCGNCVTACPYNARYLDPLKHIADKCDFCQHRLARGEEPACVATCPTKARVFGNLNDTGSEIDALLKKENLIRIFYPGVNTEPNIYYSAGTEPINWPVEPTLPGDVHMPPEFWKYRG